MFLQGVRLLKKAGVFAAVFGIGANFGLFLAKLYVAISSASLSIYCDAVNNLLDIGSCAVALLAFALMARLKEKPAQRLQSLCAFVIELIVAGTGLYFLYNGLQRALYPIPISYSYKYAAVIAATIPAKALMAFIYSRFNKGLNSGIIKALVLDSVLDCGITAFTLIGLILVPKAGFAADGVFALVLGGIITARAARGIIGEARALIND